MLKRYCRWSNTRSRSRKLWPRKVFLFFIGKRKKNTRVRYFSSTLSSFTSAFAVFRGHLGRLPAEKPREEECRGRSHDLFRRVHATHVDRKNAPRMGAAGRTTRTCWGRQSLVHEAVLRSSRNGRYCRRPPLKKKNEKKPEHTIVSITLDCSCR